MELLSGKGSTDILFKKKASRAQFNKTHLNFFVYYRRFEIYNNYLQ